MRFDIEDAKYILNGVASLENYPRPVFVHGTRVNMSHEQVAKISFDSDSGVYQCLLLADWNLIKGEELQDGTMFRIDRLTAFGHDVLEKLNDDGIWNKIKNAAQMVKSVAEFISLIKSLFPDGWVNFLSRG